MDLPIEARKMMQSKIIKNGVKSSEPRTASAVVITAIVFFCNQSQATEAAHDRRLFHCVLQFVTECDATRIGRKLDAHCMRFYFLREIHSRACWFCGVIGAIGAIIAALRVRAEWFVDSRPRREITTTTRPRMGAAKPRREIKTSRHYWNFDDWLIRELRTNMCRFEWRRGAISLGWWFLTRVCPLGQTRITPKINDAKFDFKNIKNSIILHLID